MTATGLNSPSIGVVIPVYNRVHVIHEALGCIAAQSLCPKRVVVVDDGSTDGSHEVVEAFIVNNPEIDIRLIRKPNGGVSSARNRAVAELSDCDLLAMIDSDDLWPADYLERMIQPFGTLDNDVVATFCDQDFVDLKTGETRHRDLAIYNDDTTRRMYLYGPPTPSCTVLRRDAFESAGGYREDLLAAEDYALHLELSLTGRWRHVAGCSVQMRRSIDHHTEDAKHLTSMKNLFFDVSRTRMVEGFGRANTRAISNKPWVWRRFVSDLWAGLATEQAEHGALKNAAPMYWRAFNCAPWRLGLGIRALAIRIRRGSADLDRLVQESLAVSRPNQTLSSQTQTER